MTNTNISANAIRHIGWKYFNSIRKKAMEQEFSWSGLLISLSIAFFIVFSTSQALNFAYEKIAAVKNHETAEQKIYYLENIKTINIEASENFNTKYIKNYLNKQLA
jgi:hypothetical protein